MLGHICNWPIRLLFDAFRVAQHNVRMHYKRRSPRAEASTVVCLREEDLPFERPPSEPGQPGEKPGSESADSPVEDTGQRLLCVACGYPVTSESERIEKSGAHAHTFFNPHGLVFEVGCFAAAPGCTAMGETSSEFTWFAGYLWRIGVCRRCGLHLGWRYMSEGGTFHGLILTHLKPESF